ncbi:MAG: hypothetical protein QOJ64_3298, partial [Acidobacteriota bacterium]|nr:hypothetical protein [Acidobacteriota bacterium]
MSWIIEQDELHITIGTVPHVKTDGERRKLDLQSDLQMTKAALLYANRATLCSATSSALLAMLALGETPRAERWELVKTLVTWIPDKEMEQQVAILSEFYERARRKRYSREGERLLRRFNQALAEGWDRIVEHMERFVTDVGGDGIVDAVNSQFLEIYEFDSPLRRFADDAEHEGFVLEYVKVVGDAVSDAHTYPLFDRDTSGLISAGIAAGVIPVSESGVSRGKEAGLAADLIERLPVFDRATVREVLDIRTELEVPLQRFRSAMITFSENIKSAAWNKDFTSDAELVFRREIAPTVIDIEEAVRSNSFLSELASRVVDKPLASVGNVTGATVISALAVSMSNLPLTAVAALALSPVLVAGSLIYDTYKKYNER